MARVENGVLKEIRGNPQARGKACVKSMSGISLEYSPDRLTHPLKRVGERGEGRFERISWNEAMDIMTGKLKALRDRQRYVARRPRVSTGAARPGDRPGNAFVVGPVHLA